MSSNQTNVEERVVSIDIDNSKLEKKAPKTIEALKKVEEALKFKTVKGTAKNVNKELNSINVDKLNKTLDALQKRFSLLGIASATAVQNVTNRAIDNLYNKTIGRVKQVQNFVKSSIVTGGINRAMNLENAHFQMQGLLKDEEKVAAVMKNVSDSVDGTAYSLDAAAKAASQFAASGMQAGDEMFRALRGVAGVAAMTNSEYESISQIFTTVAGNGRLMGDQLLQLSSRGINAAAVLAEQMHKTEFEVREMVTKGQISFKQFAAAMDNAFGEHAKNANKTFTGALSNVKAALARIGADFVSPLIVQEGPLVKLFNTIRARINDIKKETPAVAEYFVNGVTKITDALVEHLSREEDFHNYIKIAAVLVSALKSVIEGAVSVLKIMRDAWIQVFPPATFEQLYYMAALIKTFADNLVITGRNAQNLQDAFAGLFSIIDIVGFFTTKGISLAFAILSSVLSACGWDVLDLLGVVGRLVVAFDDWLWNNKLVNAAIQTVSDQIIRAIRIVIAFKNAIKETGAAEFVFNNMMSIGKASVGSLRKVLAIGITAFQEFAKTISNMEVITPSGIFKAVLGLFLDLSKAFVEGGKIVMSASTSALNVYKTAFNILDKYFHGKLSVILGDILAILNNFGSGLVESAKKLDIGIGEVAAVLAGIGVVKIGKSVDKLITVIGNFSAIPKSMAGTITSFNKVLTSVANTITKVGKAKAFEMRANAIKTLALSLLIITAAMVALAVVWNRDSGAFLAAGGAIVVIIALVIAMVAVMNKADIKGAIKTTGAIAAVASGLFLIGMAIARVAKIPWKKLIVSVGAIAGVLLILVGAVALLKLIKGDDTTNMKTLIGMGVSLVVLAKALQQLQKVRHPGVALLAMLSACLSLVTINAVAKRINGDSMKRVIGMALSLIVLAGSLSIISKMNVKSIYTGLAYMIPVFAVLLTIQTLSALIGKIGDSSKGFGRNVMAISASLILFALGLKVIGSLGKETILKAIPVLAAFTGVISALMFMSKFAGDNAIKAGVMIGIIAGAIIALSVAAVALGHIDTGTLLKGVGAVSALMLVVGATMKLATSGKNDSVKIMGLAVIIGELVIALGLISTMPVEDVQKSVIALVSLMLSLGIMTRYVESINLTSLGIITLLMLELTGVIWALSKIPMDGDASASTVLAISGLMITMSACLAIIANVGTVATSAIVTMGVLTGVVGLISYFLWCLRDLDGNNILKIATALSEVTIVLGVLTAILGKVGELGVQAIAEGALGLGAVIIVITAVMGFLGWLVDAIQSRGVDMISAFDMGIVIAGKVGEFVGALAGGLIGGFVEWASNGVGEGIKIMGESLAGFAKAFEGIKPEAGETAKSICLAFIELAAANLINAISSFLGGGIDYEKFSDGIGKLGEGLAKFASETSEIKNWEGVKHASKALVNIAEAASEIPNTGGVLGAFVGNNDIDDFMDMVDDAIPKLKNLAGKTAAMKPQRFQGLIMCAKVIADLAKAASEIPNDDSGIVSFFTGDNELDDFIDTFDQAFPKLKELVNKTAGMKRERFNGILNMTNALGQLIRVADTIPNEGGVVSFFTGDNSIDKFITGLSDSSENLATFVNSTAAITSWDGVPLAAKAIATMCSITDDIPNQGGAIANLIGDNKIGTFMYQLGAATENFMTFINATAAVPSWEGVPLAAKAITQMVEAGQNINDGGALGKIFGSHSFASFAEDLGVFGTAIADFAEKVTGDEIEKFQTLSTGVRDAIYVIASQNVSETAKELDKGGDTIVSTIEQILDNIGKTIDSKKSGLRKRGIEIGTLIADSIKSRYDYMVSTGKYLMEGLKKGMEDGTKIAEDAAVTAAQNVDEAIRSKKGFDIHSPGLKAVFEGIMVMKGLAKGIDKSKLEPLKSIFNVTDEMNDALSKGLKDIMPEIDVNSLSSAATAVTNDVGKMSTASSAASTSVKKDTSETKSAFEELRDSIADTVKESVKLFDEFTKKETMSSKTIIKNLKSQVNGIRNWSKNIQLLMARGLNSALAEELAKMGPESAGYVNSLLTMTDKELEKVNALYKERLSLNDATANAIAVSMYTGGYAAAAAYQAGYNSGSSSTKSSSTKSSSKKSSSKSSGTTAPIVDNSADKYIERINNVLNFDFRKAVNAAAKSMEFGGAALKKFASMFLGTTANFKIGTKAIKAAQGAITQYGETLYKNSQYYEEDMAKQKEATDTYNTYAKRYKDLNAQIKKEEANRSSNSKKYIKQEEANIKKRNKLIKKLSKSNKDADKATVNLLKYYNRQSEKNIKDAKKNGDKETRERIARLKAERDQVKQLMKESQKECDAINSEITEHMAEAFNAEVESISNSIKSFLDPLSISLENNVDLFTKFESAATKRAQAQKDLTSLRAEEEKLLADIEKYRLENTVKSRKLMEEAQDRLAEIQDKISEAQSTLDESNKITKESILENMRSQVSGVEDWKKKLDKLAEKGLAKGLLEKLKEMGPSGIDYVDRFMEMTAKEMDEASALFKKSSHITAENLLSGFIDKKATARAWSDGLKQMAKLGFSGDLIKALTDKGVDSYEYVKAFLEMTPAEREKWNKEYADSFGMSEDIALEVIDSVAYAGAAAGKDFLSAMTAMSQSGSDANKALQDNAAEIAKILKEGINAGDIGKKTAKNIASGLSKALKKTYSKKLNMSGKTIGENVVKGLEKGFKSDSATKAAKSMANSIIKAVKKEFKIKSPSRVFTEIGKFNMLGLAKGYEDNGGLAIDSATDVVKSTMKRIESLVDNDINYDPVISPILDLSEIQNGTTKINDLLGGIESATTLRLDTMATNTFARQFDAQNAVTTSDIKSVIRAIKNLEMGNYTFNNDFNLDGADPRELADEISVILQRQIERRNAVWA